MESASPHQRFFSSLDLVEKRMASEGSTKTLIGANPIPISSSSDHQLSSPLYLLNSNPVPHSGTSSAPPLDFLSNMTPQEQRSPGDGDEDEIERLIELLGGEGMYLKCGKEERRLDGWIEYYRRERKEPARLAHLLLAKAVSFSGNGGFAGMGFPSTVEEFLRLDPPAR